MREHDRYVTFWLAELLGVGELGRNGERLSKRLRCRLPIGFRHVEQGVAVPAPGHRVTPVRLRAGVLGGRLLEHGQGSLQSGETGSAIAAVIHGAPEHVECLDRDHARVVRIPARRLVEMLVRQRADAEAIHAAWSLARLAIPEIRRLRGKCPDDSPIRERQPETDPVERETKLALREATRGAGIMDLPGDLALYAKAVAKLARSHLTETGDLDAHFVAHLGRGLARTIELEFIARAGYDDDTRAESLSRWLGLGAQKKKPRGEPKKKTGKGRAKPRKGASR